MRILTRLFCIAREQKSASKVYGKIPAANRRTQFSPRFLRCSFEAARDNIVSSYGCCCLTARIADVPIVDTAVGFRSNIETPRRITRRYTCICIESADRPTDRPTDRSIDTKCHLPRRSSGSGDGTFEFKLRSVSRIHQSSGSLPHRAIFRSDWNRMRVHTHTHDHLSSLPIISVSLRILYVERRLVDFPLPD